jgi:hypothetical protein
MGEFTLRRKAAATGGSVVVGMFVVVSALMLTAGCGEAPVSVNTTDAVVPSSAVSSSTTTQAAPVSTTAAPSPSSSSTTTLVQGRPGGVVGVFARLAASVQPMTVFAPTVLPDGAALAPHWLPVVDSSDPQAYDGPKQDNPRVVGEGADSEIQVVFRVGHGWLVVIENFHGDLGDVTGTPVGSVAGNAAGLFEVNGGELVQWSKDGLWYGVFGRGLGRDAILAAALGMKAVSAESP